MEANKTFGLDSEFRVSVFFCGQQRALLRLLFKSFVIDKSLWYDILVAYQGKDQATRQRLEQGLQKLYASTNPGLHPYSLGQYLVSAVIGIALVVLLDPLFALTKQ